MICKPSQRMRVDDNLVEGNHIIGAEGVGIDITRAPVVVDDFALVRT